MGTRHEKIPTSALKPGFYVEWLDRPWTETPFPFQGFLIQDQEEVAELQRCCEFVIVDTTRSERTDPVRSARTPAPRPLPPEPGTRTIVDAARAELDTVRILAKPEPTPQERYPIHHEVEREIGTAERIHLEATQAADALLRRLKDERRIDLELADRTVAPMIDSILRNPNALVWLTRFKDHDSYSYRHAIDCAIWGLVFARHLALDRRAIHEVGLGCLLFDVGKTTLPVEVLTKRTPLTPREWLEVTAHAAKGAAMLERTPGIARRIVEMARWHHERFDGTGYPDGLKGNQIPTFAKIAGIVDCYDALVSPRPYASPLPPSEALREVYSWRGNLFQSEVVERFIRAVGVFPVGSVVELNTGHVAVVVAQNEARRLRPRLMLLRDRLQRRLRRSEIVDLMRGGPPWTDSKQVWIVRHLRPDVVDLDPKALSP